jgi:hypothetical protein
VLRWIEVAGTTLHTADDGANGSKRGVTFGDDEDLPPPALRALEYVAVSRREHGKARLRLLSRCVGVWLALRLRRDG